MAWALDHEPPIALAIVVIEQEVMASSMHTSRNFIFVPAKEIEFLNEEERGLTEVELNVHSKLKMRSEFEDVEWRNETIYK